MENIFKTNAVTLFAAMLVVIAMGCSDNAVSPEPDFFPATFLVEGVKINMKVCYPGSSVCDPGDVISADTIETSFKITVNIVNQRPDTLQFFELEKFNNSPQCSYNSHVSDCAYARLEDNILYFDRIIPSGWYHGEGKLDENVLTLQTQFSYRGLRIDYFLEGEKIEE